MLPVGHLAGAYIAGKAVGIFVPQINQPKYLILATLFGLLPDLDFVAVFAKTGKFTISEDVDHHQFPSHAPLLYVLAFLIWLIAWPATYLVAVTFITGVLVHFVLDTLASDGVAWLYPFSKRMVRISRDPKIPHPNTSFKNFWFDFLKQYLKLTAFRMEIGLTIIALIIFLLTK